MKSITRLCVIMALLLVFTVPAFGEADLSYDTAWSFNGNTYYDSNSLTAPDKVSGGDFPFCNGACSLSGGYGYASGYANATQLKVGINTSAGATDPNDGGSSTATAYMVNTFTVHDSGVAIGTPVTLKLTMNLDGSINVSGGAQAQGQADLGIIAGSTVPRPGQGEFYQPELLSFTANWNVIAGSYGYSSQVGWQADKISGYNQNNYGIMGAGSYYTLCQSGGQCYYSSTSNVLNNDGTFEPMNLSLGTGSLGLGFNANVGQTYSLYEYLYNQGGFGGGYIIGGGADVDFSHTFAGIVTSDDPNVVLDWNVPLTASTTVPEPATILLLGLGLVGLARVRRKFKQ